MFIRFTNSDLIFDLRWPGRLKITLLLSSWGETGYKTCIISYDFWNLIFDLSWPDLDLKSPLRRQNILNSSRCSPSIWSMAQNGPKTCVAWPYNYHPYYWPFVTWPLTWPMTRVTLMVSQDLCLLTQYHFRRNEAHGLLRRASIAVFVKKVGFWPLTSIWPDLWPQT